MYLYNQKFQNKSYVKQYKDNLELSRKIRKDVREYFDDQISNRVLNMMRSEGRLKCKFYFSSLNIPKNKLATIGGYIQSKYGRKRVNVEYTNYITDLYGQRVQIQDLVFRIN